MKKDECIRGLDGKIIETLHFDFLERVNDIEQVSLIAE
jgi:hypothetical protein